MISISVIIPTLEEAPRIGALLDALQRQEYSGDVEIIVADGGSQDKTQQIVRDYPQVLLIESAPGTGRQRNAGAMKATGELLVFMDADDLPSPRFLMKVASSFKRLPFAVACPWFVATDSGVLVRALYAGFNVLFFLGQSWLRTGSGVCLIVRREVFEKIGGFDESLHLGEDVNIIRRASRHGLHRHLLIPLETSGRRFREKGALQLLLFYVRISPNILLGRWKALQQVDYQAAPYREPKA